MKDSTIEILMANQEKKAQWKFMMLTQKNEILNNACHEYVDGLSKIKLFEDVQPTIAQINGCLSKHTSWKVNETGGALNMEEIFRCLSKKQFPMNMGMRRISELNFSELPDFFHDYVGHCPILTNEYIGNIYQRFGKIGLMLVNNREKFNLICHLFWFSMEVGLIKQEGGIKVFGAAILTSSEEMKNVYNPMVEKIKLSLELIAKDCSEFRRVQHKYYIISSFEEINEMLNQIEAN